MNKKKFIVLILMMQHLFLLSQISYFNLQFEEGNNLWQGGAKGVVEVDSFYYVSALFAHPSFSQCDTGLLMKINKYNLDINYLKIPVEQGARVHNIIWNEYSNELILNGSTYACHQDGIDDGFYLGRVSLDSFLLSDITTYQQSNRGDYPSHSIKDEDGNYILAGHSFIAGSPIRQSILIFKADSSFNEIFYRRYPSGSPAYNYFGNDIVATPDGGYIVVGNHRLEDYTEDAALIFKINAQGDVQWWHEFMPDHGLYEENLYFTSIVQKENGEYLVIGFKTINPQGEILHEEYWAASFDENGEMLSENQFHENYRAGIIKITPSNDGNYYICGSDKDEVDYETNYFKQYGTVGKITPDGDLLWLRKYHEEQIYAYTDVFWNVIPTEDGGILCIGATYPNDEERQNIWVMKLDSLGCAEPDCDPSVGIIELPVGGNSPVLLYPNPTSGIFTVAAKDEITFIEKLIINDANGRQVFQKIDNRSAAILVDLENAAAGMYFCRMEMGGVWYVRQVLVSW